MNQSNCRPMSAMMAGPRDLIGPCSGAASDQTRSPRALLVQIKLLELHEQEQLSTDERDDSAVRSGAISSALLWSSIRSDEIAKGLLVRIKLLELHEPEQLSPDERDDSAVRSGAISSGLALEQHPIRRDRQGRSSSRSSCSNSMNQSNYRPMSAMTARSEAVRSHRAML
jgi:hypothetical protein